MHAAESIASAYGSAGQLLEAYGRMPSDAAREAMLANLLVGPPSQPKRRRLGNVQSKRIMRLFHSLDPLEICGVAEAD
jgi:hypothetical protein